MTMNDGLVMPGDVMKLDLNKNNNHKNAIGGGDNVKNSPSFGSDVAFGNNHDEHFHENRSSAMFKSCGVLSEDEKMSELEDFTRGSVAASFVKEAFGEDVFDNTDFGDDVFCNTQFHTGDAAAANANADDGVVGRNHGGGNLASSVTNQHQILQHAYSTEEQAAANCQQQQQLDNDVTPSSPSCSVSTQHTSNRSLERRRQAGVSVHPTPNEALSMPPAMPLSQQMDDMSASGSVVSSPTKKLMMKAQSIFCNESKDEGNYCVNHDEQDAVHVV